jgi:flagellar biogenesis protein FliO
MGRNLKKGIFLIALLMMAIWSLHQLKGVLFPEREQQNPINMLYQVSLFQIELLNGFLDEASGATNTEQLHMLRQSAYSANYTHERFVLAVGGSEVSHLKSLSSIVQYVLRLQIGGQRDLKEKEQNAIREVSKSFKDIYSIYETLLSSSYEVISSQNAKLDTIDQKVSNYLQEMLLE